MLMSSNAQSAYCCWPNIKLFCSFVVQLLTFYICIIFCHFAEEPASLLAAIFVIYYLAVAVNVHSTLSFYLSVAVSTVLLFLWQWQIKYFEQETDIWKWFVKTTLSHSKLLHSTLQTRILADHATFKNIQTISLQCFPQIRNLFLAAGGVVSCS